MPSPNREILRTAARPGAHAASSAWRRRSCGSVNAEIEFLLREALKKRGVKVPEGDGK